MPAGMSPNPQLVSVHVCDPGRSLRLDEPRVSPVCRLMVKLTRDDARVPIKFFPVHPTEYWTKRN